ncbi:murein hydrolase activator EnvC family protein [Dysosmobacter sp.]|uniref:murein hydrolase activator EnvC family protein n=1 Tax=Dysosmobacter sp. TaxID=2591382 RepID=UPI002A9F8C1E|nr:peptidoglycan DD-metalloendopeptidase family protein [Dysosmobacter sp.]MCI6053771.1 peptidoglycan DD-metalloendopeptidase family protein [Dysosmobacter sp.]MDY5509194.1 peptidoglycan DD-metalloendopeptidase family protein [Dysosmobacter sp.]
MKKQTKGRRFFQALLALTMALLLSAAELTPALAVTQADIDALKNESNDLSAEKKELQAKLESLAADKSTAMERKTLLDQQIANTSAQISNVEEQIQQYAALISQKEEELIQAQEDEAAQYDLFCDRVRAMEKRGEVSYWSVLFRADSFTDLLSRLDMINEIMAADQRVIDQLKDLQAQIETAKTELETNKAEEEAAKSELEARKSELNTQRSEANALIQQLAANESETEAALDELEAEQDAIRAEIQRLNEQLIAQQAANGNSVQSNPGGYIWPVDSRYITSTMGGRASPGGVGSTNHKGTDIGRVGYTSPIYASKAGTVIVSQYSSSYGNYVAISHGSGNTTLYAHMSSRKVSVGQYVNQGDVIGITGSTGNSTGPHLHFEVTENGVRVNPLSHGAEPRMGYLTGYTLSGSA